MKFTFFEKLTDRISQVDSLLCVGLDPHPEDLVELSGSQLREFCLRLIEQTHPFAAAYKPNAAFFEAAGAEGAAALRDVIAEIPGEIPVILDVKRGDISSTAQAYARAAYQYYQVDGVTISPYLGRETVSPFISDPSKGAFVLCKTSNPGASDLQDSILAGSGKPLYLQTAALTSSWQQTGNLGLVVGATQLESLRRVREQDDGIWILAPGVGAQGGRLSEALRAGLREDGRGLLIPVSRGISRSEHPGRAARKLQKEINQVRDQLLKSRQKNSGSGSAFSLRKQRIARGLLDQGCIQFGEFELKSGLISPFYIDLRRLIHQPDFLWEIAGAYQEMLQKLTFDHLAGLPYAALPISTAISLLGGYSLVYPRKETKGYGTDVPVEGIFRSGETAVIVDDLITTGGSKLEAVQRLESRNLIVQDIVVLIDRSVTARKELAERGYSLYAYLSIWDLMDFYKQEQLVDQDLLRKVELFLDDAGS